MTEEESVSSNDPRKLKEQGLKAKHREKQADEDLRVILAMPEGRRFIHSLLGYCRLLQISGSNNAVELGRHDGIRTVGTKMLADVVRVAPERLTQVLIAEPAKPSPQTTRRDETSDTDDASR